MMVAGTAGITEGGDSSLTRFSGYSPSSVAIAYSPELTSAFTMGISASTVASSRFSSVTSSSFVMPR